MSTVDSKSTLRHPIGVVARRTGLKPDLIRAWERRYGAVEPGRTETRRRFYSDADVERLLLLRRAVSTGRGISQVAGLTIQELEALVEADARSAPRTVTPVAASPARPVSEEDLGDLTEGILAHCLAAAQSLDVRELETQIERASVTLSRPHLIEQILVPLMRRVGELWHQGAIRPIHEHMASAVVRSFLGALGSGHQPAPSAPHLVVTTPSRQHHELGALIVAVTAEGEGWQVTYLGPELPPEEIAAAARQKGARAVALSLTYPPDDPLLVDDLRKLRRLLGSRTALVVGGQASQGYAPILEEVGSLRVDSLAELRRHLQALRSEAGKI